MTFTVILMNAPYLKGKWVKCLEKAIELNPDYILQISPDGTGNFSPRSEKIEELFLDNGCQVYEDCTKYFYDKIDAGKIIYAMLDLNADSKPDVLKNTSIEGDIVLKYISHPGHKVESILNKKRDKTNIRAPRFDSKKKGTIRNLESVGNDGPTYKWINEENTHVVNGKDYWFVNRYFGKNLNCYIEETDEVIGMSTNVIAIERIPNVSTEKFKEVMLSDGKRFVLSVLRYGMHDTSPRHLRQLSFADDSEMGLTEKERNYIKSSLEK